MTHVLVLHMITVLSLLIFKIGLLVVGFLIVRMGYNLLCQGISGKFEFRGAFTGAKADLASTSPGLLFLLLGVILLTVAVVKDKPFATSFRSLPSAPPERGTTEPLVKPKLPDKPPGT